MFIYPRFAGRRHRDLIAAAGARWGSPAGATTMHTPVT